jgi:hypothetical protein
MTIWDVLQFGEIPVLSHHTRRHKTLAARVQLAVGTELGGGQHSYQRKKGERKDVLGFRHLPRNPTLPVLAACRPFDPDGVVELLNRVADREITLAVGAMVFQSVTHLTMLLN